MPFKVYITIKLSQSPGTFFIIPFFSLDVQNPVSKQQEQKKRKDEREKVWWHVQDVWVVPPSRASLRVQSYRQRFHLLERPGPAAILLCNQNPLRATVGRLLSGNMEASAEGLNSWWQVTAQPRQQSVSKSPHTLSIYNICIQCIKG